MPRAPSSQKFVRIIPISSFINQAAVATALRPEQQKDALTFIQKNVLDKYKSTGVQDILDKAVFDLLKYLAIFPGGVNKLQDSEGRYIPDCFLMPPNSTALNFAYKIHTTIGDTFIKAIDVRKKMVVGKDYKLKNRDVIEIVCSK